MLSCHADAVADYAMIALCLLFHFRCFRHLFIDAAFIFMIIFIIILFILLRLSLFSLILFIFFATMLYAMLPRLLF